MRSAARAAVRTTQGSKPEESSSYRTVIRWLINWVQKVTDKRYRRAQPIRATGALREAQARTATTTPQIRRWLNARRKVLSVPEQRCVSRTNKREHHQKDPSRTATLTLPAA